MKHVKGITYPQWYVKCFDSILDIWYPLTHVMQESRIRFITPLLDILFYLFEYFLSLLAFKKAWKTSMLTSLLREWYFHSFHEFLKA